MGREGLGEIHGAGQGVSGHFGMLCIKDLTGFLQNSYSGYCGKFLR